MTRSDAKELAGILSRFAHPFKIEDQIGDSNVVCDPAHLARINLLETYKLMLNLSLFMRILDIVVFGSTNTFKFPQDISQRQNLDETFSNLKLYRS